MYINILLDTVLANFIVAELVTTNCSQWWSLNMPDMCVYKMNENLIGSTK